MKVIDLLNKMSNDLNYRPTVKFLGTTYIYDEVIGDYKNNRNFEGGVFSGYVMNNILNDKVEVIEEDKEIDTINAYKLIEAPYLADCLKEKKFDEVAESLKQSELEIVKKVNDLVYVIKKLNKESEEK